MIESRWDSRFLVGPFTGCRYAQPCALIFNPSGISSWLPLDRGTRERTHNLESTRRRRMFAHSHSESGRTQPPTLHIDHPSQRDDTTQHRVEALRRHPVFRHPTNLNPGRIQQIPSSPTPANNSSKYDKIIIDPLFHS